MSLLLTLFLTLSLAACGGKSGDIYFFDEPFRELDKSTADTVRELVKRECSGKTVILATHEPADVDFFDALKFEFTGSPMTLANQPL